MESRKQRLHVHRNNSCYFDSEDELFVAYNYKENTTTHSYLGSAEHHSYGAYLLAEGSDGDCPVKGFREQCKDG